MKWSNDYRRIEGTFEIFECIGSQMGPRIFVNSFIDFGEGDRGLSLWARTLKVALQWQKGPHYKWILELHCIAFTLISSASLFHCNLCECEYGQAEGWERGTSFCSNTAGINNRPILNAVALLLFWFMRSLPIPSFVAFLSEFRLHFACVPSLPLRHWSLYVLFFCVSTILDMPCVFYSLHLSFASHNLLWCDAIDHIVVVFYALSCSFIECECVRFSHPPLCRSLVASIFRHTKENLPWRMLSEASIARQHRCKRFVHNYLGEARHALCPPKYIGFYGFYQFPKISIHNSKVMWNEFCAAPCSERVRMHPQWVIAKYLYSFVWSPRILIYWNYQNIDSICHYARVHYARNWFAFPSCVDTSIY